MLTIGGAVGLFGLQAVLSDAIHDSGGGATRLDTAVAAFAVGHRTPVLTAVAETLNVGGGLAGLTVLAAVVATALLARHRRLEAALVLAAPAAAGLLGNASKLGYDRARPPVAGHLVTVTTPRCRPGTRSTPRSCSGCWPSSSCRWCTAASRGPR